MTFTPIASSSAGCSYLVEHQGLQPILIDCGVPIAQLRQALGFTVSGLGACLISHAHGDHCLAAGDLMSAGVVCYAAPETWSQLAARLAKKPNFHRRRALFALDEIEVSGYRVLSFAVIHDCPGTLGFLIGAEKHKLLYITDSMYAPNRFDGLTHIAIECNHSLEIVQQNAKAGTVDRSRYHRTARTHMSLETVLGFLKANDLSKVQEIHLLHLSDANSDEAAFKEAVASATGVPTYVAGKGGK